MEKRDLIDRQEAIEYACHAYISGSVTQRIKDLLNQVPARGTHQTATWKETRLTSETIDGVQTAVVVDACTACGFWKPTNARFLDFKYCPNCGARMDD